ncbi:glycosyltransferase [Chloroflexota bacterium]
MKKDQTESKDYSYQPFVSVIIPIYNEAGVIERRIDNLLALEYPDDKFEIIVVDSGSNDNSLEIARRTGQNNSRVTILEEGERRGKASAINYGKSIAKGEIILVTDVNTIFDINVLKEITPHFSKPDVGGVGGRFVPVNDDNNMFEASVYYWELESLIRRGESAWDSACLFHGEINAWRKDIIETDTEALAEDLEMAIRINRKGLKIVYEPSAIAHEPVPTTYKEQIIQKKRTVIGTIQGFLKHKKYLLLPRDRYSGVIFPSHKILQIISPFLVIGWTITAVLLIWQNIFAAFIITGTSLLIYSASLVLLSIILPRYETVDKNTEKRFFRIHILYTFRYVLLHEYIILLAWKDYIFRNYYVQWEMVASTRKTD